MKKFTIMANHQKSADLYEKATGKVQANQIIKKAKQNGYRNFCILQDNDSGICGDFKDVTEKF